MTEFSHSQVLVFVIHELWVSSDTVSWNKLQYDYRCYFFRSSFDATLLKILNSTDFQPFFENLLLYRAYHIMIQCPSAIPKSFENCSFIYLISCHAWDGSYVHPSSWIMRVCSDLLMTKSSLLLDVVKPSNWLSTFFVFPFNHYL